MRAGNFASHIERSYGSDRMKKIGIYKIQSKIKPERCYIGSATDITKRKSTHFIRLRRGIHNSIILQNHFNKYGESDLEFSILLLCERNDLLKAEQFFIDSINPYFNICKIAGSPLGLKKSEEHKRKLREINLGKKHSQETIEKMKEAHKGHQNTLGKKWSEETKKKQSESIKIWWIKRKQKAA